MSKGTFRLFRRASTDTIAGEEKGLLFPSRLLERPMRKTLPLALLLLFFPGCGEKPHGRPSSEADSSPRAPSGPWEGELPPIPSRPSARFTPQEIHVTTKLDKQAAYKRLGDLALAASREVEGMVRRGERARLLAALCLRAAPYAATDVVDGLARAAFAAAGKVKNPDRLQDPFENLAKCLAHAGDKTRSDILPALLSRAAKAKDLSVYSWPFRSARSALGNLTAAQVEPILRQAQGLLARAQLYFHKEHLLSGMAAAGTVLPPARALALLARAEQGVAGAAHNESRPVFFGELADTWVELAGKHPDLMSRAASAIVRLAKTPYRRAQALAKLIQLETFPGSKQAPAVLGLVGSVAAKLPSAEKGFLQEKIIEQAARIDDPLKIIRKTVNEADEPHAARSRITAVGALAARHPKEAVVYANEALDLLDKLPEEARRNWGQAPLFRALAKIDPGTREPLLKRMEERAARFKDKYFTAWTLRRLVELQKKSNPKEALRLQKEMMAAVNAVPEAAMRVRALRGIYKVQLESGPAAASSIIAQAVKLSDKGVGAWVWARFIEPLEKRPEAEQKRWLPVLLESIVKQASTWRPDNLSRWSRYVANLAPKVMDPVQAEKLMLQVWLEVETAEQRSDEVQVQQVINALRHLGAGLARLGSSHFPTLVRRVLARIPEQKAWSEHLMSYVSALGTLLPAPDAAQLRKRLKAWVDKGGEKTRLVRRGAIVAGLVASHGAVDQEAVRYWLAQGEAHLSWRPMVQFLIRLPIPDLEKKAAALPGRWERYRMFLALIRATEERAKQETRWRRRRRQQRQRGQIPKTTPARRQ